MLPAELPAGQPCESSGSQRESGQYVALSAPTGGRLGVCWCVHRVYALMPPELGGKGEHRAGQAYREVGSELLCLGSTATRRLIYTHTGGCDYPTGCAVCTRWVRQGNAVGVVARVSLTLAHVHRSQRDMVGYSSRGSGMWYPCGVCSGSSPSDVGVRRGEPWSRWLRSPGRKSQVCVLLCPYLAECPWENELSSLLSVLI